jgi:uncharacterized protein YxeA
MPRNTLFIIIAVLIVAVAAVYIYREQHKPGLEIKADDSGLSIQKN